MSDIIYKDESYRLIGVCMDVHKLLGNGLSEIVYKDALEYEFTTNKIPFKREKEYIVRYKDIILKHNFFADFVVFDSIILEIKACKSLTEEFSKQTLNYLAITRLKLGLIINFGERSLTYKRIVL